MTFSATLASIIFSTRPLKKIILNDSDRLNRIIQKNVFHVIYNVKIKEIFDVKVVNAIYPRVYTVHQGITVICFTFCNDLKS